MKGHEKNWKFRHEKQTWISLNIEKKYIQIFVRTNIDNQFK